MRQPLSKAEKREVMTLISQLLQEGRHLEASSLYPSIYPEPGMGRAFWHQSH